MKQSTKPVVGSKTLDTLVAVTELALTYRYLKECRRFLIWREQFQLHPICYDFRTRTNASKLKIKLCWRSHGNGNW